MARTSLVVCATFILVGLLDGVLSEEASHHWAYSGEGAPAHWANMPKYEACGLNKQSPINIVTDDLKYKHDLKEFVMSGYDKEQGTLFLHNNGHTVQVDTNDANWTVSGGSLDDTYKLLQFHFHWGKDSKTGSEHTIDSTRYPLEMHMVHMSTKYDDIKAALGQDKSLTVITMMFEVGADDNEHFKTLTDGLKNVTHEGENETLKTFAIRPMMPSNLTDYYTYSGSLTTPPCSQVVVWNIFRETVKISKKQLNSFRALVNYKANALSHAGGNGPLVDNFRPVNALNGRTVYKSFMLGHEVNEAGHHWGYAHGGPANWSDDCTLNHHQSPIDIHVSDAKHDPSLGAFYLHGYNEKQGVLTLNNNGHSAQVDTTGANWTVSGGSLNDTYKLLQFHFHWGQDDKTGSEHTIDSRQYPLEMHMVHMSETFDNVSYALPVARSLTVLGIMFEVGNTDNGNFQELTDKLAEVVYSGQNVMLTKFHLRKLMPDSLGDYYTYEGSLTTPPCSEVVVWNIFRETVKISEKQLNAFRALRVYTSGEEKKHGEHLEEGFMYGNYRPVQPLSGRTVRRSFEVKLTPADKKEENAASAVSACLTVLLTSLLASRLYSL